MDFLFLPPIYILALVFSGVVSGFIFDALSRKRVIVNSAFLFGTFTISQLIFRILLNETPERLVGQAIYYFLFLGVVFLAGKAKERFIG